MNTLRCPYSYTSENVLSAPNHLLQRGEAGRRFGADFRDNRRPEQVTSVTCEAGELRILAEKTVEELTTAERTQGLR
jgi:hypothetical protein